ncbi:MIP/aquaporin family protein [Streptacidiphilus fuscans]|uniref:Aquaporin family protein n=1 Tax=Streptacidiphilus fuscans TaxID=2789292 RepID=A0A931FFI6_9ACTN|nr:MIP/aquaporin family protein [Streptacidiphilus fuscans]MBF9069891.1 aquaporin family protein [Streptacidiphilus fuscans]
MSNSHIFFGELIGTALLILLGGGVCAAVTLKRSKAEGAGWLAIAFGWGFAVLVAAYTANSLSGAHLNPAVTIAIAVKTGDWSHVPVYLAGQFLGAVVGAVLVWLAYLGQFNENDEPTLGIFATGPEIRNPVQNVITETVGTTVLCLLILTQGLNKELGLSGMGILITALTVVGIGLSLGGPTGYAINPFRDLGPRLVHSLLPIPKKGSSDWGYAWVPIVGPILGALLAGGIYNAAF